MSSRYHKVLLGSLILASSAACSRMHSSNGNPNQGPTTIVFRNESLEQADVFAVRPAAGALRLGTVMAGHTDTLTIREGAVPPGATVDFVARLLTRSNTPHSGQVAVRPGDVLTVTLPPTANILAVLPGT